MSQYFKNFKLDNETLTFEVHNLNSSLCNSIRRIIISEIETLGFRSSFDGGGDINIEVNTSALHNEFLGHRLSLLPIHYPANDISTFDIDKYEFIIDITNNTDNTIDVTTKDIKILDKLSEKYLSESETRKFFPSNYITGDYIIINRLKPNKAEGTDGEALKIRMKADRGTGHEHSRYTPTCVSVFTNKMDEVKFERVIQEKIASQEETMTAEEMKRFTHSLRLSEGERHFHTNEFGEPNLFEFTIESDGRIPPQIILYKSLFILSDKLNRLMKNLDNEEIVTFKNSDCIMNSYDVLIKDEDYTLGTILQNYIYSLYLRKEPRDVKYIATSVPHPLENNLAFRISLENSTSRENSIANIKKIFIGTIDYLNSSIVKLKGEIKNTFKGNLE